MSEAEKKIHLLALQVLQGDELERRLALNVLKQIALSVARAEDRREERPELSLVSNNAEENE